MARVDYWQYLLDRQGRPLEYAEVRVYLAGGLTEADIYLDSTFGSITKASSQDLKTDKYGFIQFWIGDRWEIEGGYPETQQFKIVWQNTVDSIEEIIDNLYVFTPVRPIDVNAPSVSGSEAMHRDKDKVISNTQGYDWDTHVDLTLPSGSPHGIAPVTFFDTGTFQSKVISNKLGYQMYQLATTSSTTSADVSGATSYRTTSTWLPSGGYYYQNVKHDLGNSYPVVVVSKISDGYKIVPFDIISKDANNVEIWVTENNAADILVLG